MISELLIVHVCAYVKIKVPKITDVVEAAFKVFVVYVLQIKWQLFSRALVYIVIWELRTLRTFRL